MCVLTTRHVTLSVSVGVSVFVSVLFDLLHTLSPMLTPLLDDVGRSVGTRASELESATTTHLPLHEQMGLLGDSFFSRLSTVRI